KPASAAAPARQPRAAAAANPVPCSIAKNQQTGPEVSGSPINQPLKVSPQRWPARLAAPIKTGVTISLRSSVFIGDGGGAVRDTCCSRAADTATLARAGRGAVRPAALARQPAASAGKEMRVARDELCPTGVAAG